ncbi:MAG: [LysW]-lysine hydrolase [Chloroflexaceae bacterium]|nr:[LysW]-lysine hydrolase [Chloroflexaceae bacterium]
MLDDIALLRQMVEISSPSHHEEALATFLVEQMQQLGFAARRDEAGNAIAQVGEHGPLVVLLGHIDTVAGVVPVRQEAGRLYGRGTVDAKGPFASFIVATHRAYQAGSLNCRVVLIGAVEEEAATSKGAHFVVDQYAPDYCVIGEPSGWERVTLGYKGRLLATYRHEQAGAHSAGEQKAAPEHMVDFWMAVQLRCAQYNAERDRLFEQINPSLRAVASGSDGLNDWCEATLGLRLPEAIAPEQMAEELAQMALQVTGETTISFTGHCPAFRSPRSTPLASAFVRAIRGAGGNPGFVHKTGTADMNVVGPAWKCPIVAYGPGDSRLDHAPDEHIVLDEYQRGIAVLTTVLANLS